MGSFDDPVEVLTEDGCVALLRSRDLGRIAFDVDGKVQTGPGTKLAAVPKTSVTFEVDGWDSDSGIGWSVVAKGRAEEVTTNPGRAAQHPRWVPVHPAAPGERWHWMAIKPSEITGRRFHVPPAKGKRA